MSDEAGMRTLAIAFLAALAIGVLEIHAQYAAVSPEGSDAGLSLSGLLALPFAAGALLASLASLPLLLLRRQRRRAIHLLAAGLTFLAVLVVCGNLGNQVRMDAFLTLSLRSAPLLQAIARYERERGHPPVSLDELVPAYLPAIPGTGMAAYPTYDYVSGPRAASEYGDRWALSVFTPSGGINFDQFYFVPSGSYPETGFGGWIERVGDWAYVHE